MPDQLVQEGRDSNSHFAVQVSAESIKILVQHRLYYPLESRGIIVQAIQIYQ